MIKQIIILFSCVALIACVHRYVQNQGAELPLRAPASISNAVESIIQNYEPLSTDLSFEELPEALKGHSKIADLLAYLRDKKPEYMSHYTLMHHSLSLHDASPENPRAIVYGQTGRLVISFNGHKNQAGYQALEIMRFNQQKHTFEFYEIDFNEDGTKPYDNHISAVNGPQNRCLDCHTGSRPIWNAYTLWPGAFGGVDDIGPGKSIAMTGDGVDEFLGPSFQQVAAQKWEKYQRDVADKGRYQFLPALANSTLLSYLAKTKGYEYSSEVIARPNTDLNVALAIHNFDRIGEIVRKAIGKDPIRYVLLYGLSNCRYNYESADAERIRYMASQYLEKSTPAYQDNFLGNLRDIARDHDIPFIDIKNRAVQRTYDSNYQNQLQAITDPNKFYQTIGQKQNLSPFLFQPNRMIKPEIFYFLAPLHYLKPNLNIDQFSMELFEGIHNYDNGSYGGEDFFLHHLLNKVFRQQDPQMAEEYTHMQAAGEIDNSERGQAFCAKIAKKFPAKFSQIADQILANRKKSN